MIDNVRDYGLPEGTPISVPVAKPAEGPVTVKGCPNCGCKELASVTVEMQAELLKHGRGTGTYIGCPACPWASPMLMTSKKKEEEK